MPYFCIMRVPFPVVNIPANCCSMRENISKFTLRRKEGSLISKRQEAMPKPPSFKNLQRSDGRTDRSDDGEQTADALQAKTETDMDNILRKFCYCFPVTSVLENLEDQILDIYVFIP